MTPLRQQMLTALHLSDKSERTQATSIRAVRLLAQCSHKAPDRISAQELQRSFLHRTHVDGLAPASMRLCSSGLRFFSQHVLPRDWAPRTLIRPQITHRLPAVRSVAEGKRLVASATPCPQPRLLDHRLSLGPPTPRSPVPPGLRHRWAAPARPGPSREGRQRPRRSLARRDAGAPPDLLANASAPSLALPRDRSRSPPKPYRDHAHEPLQRAGGLPYGQVPGRHDATGGWLCIRCGLPPPPTGAKPACIPGSSSGSWATPNSQRPCSPSTSPTQGRKRPTSASTPSGMGCAHDHAA